MGNDPKVKNIDLTHLKRPKCHGVVRKCMDNKGKVVMCVEGR